MLVATELETELLVASIANETICTVRSTAYRHHPSGLHRWFATPVDRLVDRRFGGISSLETSVVDDVPGLPARGRAQRSSIELYIEWDEPIIGGARVDADEPFVEEFDDSLLQAMLDESVMQYDVIEFDEVAEIDRVAEIATVRDRVPRDRGARRHRRSTSRRSSYDRRRDRPTFGCHRSGDHGAVVPGRTTSSS